MASVEADLFEEVGTIRRVLESIHIQSMVDANRIYEMLEACEETGDRRINSIVQTILESIGMEHLNPFEGVEVVEAQDQVVQDVQIIIDSDTEKSTDVEEITISSENNAESRNPSNDENGVVIIDGEFAIDSPIVAGTLEGTSTEAVNANTEADLLCDLNNNDLNNNTDFDTMEDANLRLDAGEGTSGISKSVPETGARNDSGDVFVLSDDDDESVCRGILGKRPSRMASNVASSTNLSDDEMVVDAESIRRQLLSEARNINSVLPEHSVGEVYAYLEANIDNPDRVRAVLKEFLGMATQSVPTSFPTNQSKEPIRTADKGRTNTPTEQANVVKSDNQLNSQNTSLNQEHREELQVAFMEVSDSNNENRTLQDGLQIAGALHEPPNTEGKVPDAVNLGHRKRHSSDSSENDGDAEFQSVQEKRVRFTEAENHVPEAENRGLEPEPAPQEAKTETVPLSREVQRSISFILELFPDAAYDYVANECRRFNGSPNEVQALVDQMLVSDDYPKRAAAEAVPMDVVNEGAGAAENSHGTPEERMEHNYACLLAIFPDTDPEFLQSKNRETNGDDVMFKEFLASALEGNYIMPSRKEYEKRKEDERMKLKFTSKGFNVQEFLEIFEDPEQYFGDVNRQVPQKYRSHVYAFLLREFKKVPARTIQATLSKHNDHLTPCYHQLKQYTGPFNKSARHAWEIITPNNTSLHFLQEVAYVTHFDAIKNYITEKKLLKEAAYTQARRQNALLQCGCCYDDQLIVEDMAACSEGHLFCRECIQRSTEVGFGDGKTIFHCLGPDCDAEFTLSTLQTVLKKNMFSHLVQRRQAEEVRAAGIEDLVSCPFCDYATILPKTDHILKCLNSECMIESCRLCKERSHVPLRCDEVERESEIKARTYIEDRMTEALVRTCWKCKRKFVKEDGCNKMTCTCGAYMCYICREPVKDYSHFRENDKAASNKCPLYSNNSEVHYNDVQKEAAKAKAEILQNNPKLQLKHDPTLVLPSPPVARSETLRVNLAGAINHMARIVAHYGHGGPVQALPVVYPLNIPPIINVVDQRHHHHHHHQQQQQQQRRDPMPRRRREGFHLRTKSRPST